MKKVNLKGKLTLTKEIVSNLKNSEMKKVNGGISFKSCILTVCLNDGNKACAIKLTQQFTCNCI
jgi:hypothetical protein